MKYSAAGVWPRVTILNHTSRNKNSGIVVVIAIIVKIVIMELVHIGVLRDHSTAGSTPRLLFTCD